MLKATRLENEKIIDIYILLSKNLMFTLNQSDVLIFYLIRIYVISFFSNFLA